MPGNWFSDIVSKKRGDPPPRAPSVSTEKLFGVDVGLEAPEDEAPVRPRIKLDLNDAALRAEWDRYPAWHFLDSEQDQP